jgi:glycosyltransferase involved in cell wall biosynthesis
MQKAFVSIKIAENHTNEDVMVSVAIIAYNLEKYIAEAIESVLDQITNFRVQIVVGEDCSTDNTLAILKDYQNRYPNVIKLLIPEKNQGLTPNSVATQNACEGKYIALLDGDDYWTNINKLQNQIDFLEKNSTFSASCHQAQIVFDDVAGEDRLFGAEKDTVFTIVDTLQHRKFHTSSLVYRRKFWIESGGIPTTILSNERAIYPMLAIYGRINYTAEPMCIYRRSMSGISERITMKELATDLNMIPWLKNISAKFPHYQYRSFLHFTTYTYPVRVQFFPMVKHFSLFVFFSFSYFPRNLGDVKHGLIQFFVLFKRDLIRK